MPVTTFITIVPDRPHDFPVLNELLDEFREAMGDEEWYVHVYPVWWPGRWFGLRKQRYELRCELVKRLAGSEYQVFGCAQNEREIGAFMLGAINAAQHERRSSKQATPRRLMQ